MIDETTTTEPLDSQTAEGPAQGPAPAETQAEPTTEAVPGRSAEQGEREGRRLFPEEIEAFDAALASIVSRAEALKGKGSAAQSQELPGLVSELASLVREQL